MTDETQAVPAEDVAGKRLRVGDYPVGTKAYSSIGGYWTRVAAGWQAMGGDVFPRYGGDAIEIEMPATAAETARYVAATNYLDLVKYKEHLEAEATSLRRKLEEHRKALEPFYVVAKTLPDPRLINDEAPGVMARHAPGFKAALGKLVLGDFRRVFWLMEKP